MASPTGLLGLVGIGASIAGGATQAKAAQNAAKGQMIQIQGQMMQAFGQAFGMDVQAQQYDYQAQIDKYQAGVAEVNKRISEQNAAYSRDVGEVEAQAAGMKAAADRNEMLVTQGASGLDVNVGSSARVRESMIELGAHDQAVIRASAAKKAYGYEVEATMNEAQADVYRYTASMNEVQADETRQAAQYTRTTATTIGQQAMGVAQEGGNLGVTGSLVNTVGSVASKWISGTQSGIFPSFSFG